MKVVLYARVSSDKQDVDLSISAQLKALRDYASRNGYELVKEFVDEAESGRTSARTEFKQMVSMARRPEKPFDLILVWKYSRFARSREDSILHKTMLKKYGVRVVSINEPIDDTPPGRLFEALIESMDEYYSDNLGEEVTRGMRESASRGFYLTRKPPYGYRKIKAMDGAKERTKLEIDENQSVVASSVFRDVLSGKGMTEIVKDLNNRGIEGPKGKGWGKTGLHCILRNEVYKGTLVWGLNSKRGLEPIRIENAVPAIVTREIFDTVQSLLKDRDPRKHNPRRTSSRFLLSGLAHCGHCGKAMIGQNAKGGKFAYYVCGTLMKKGADSCQAGYINSEKFERLVVDTIKRNILTPKHLTELVKLVNQKMDEKSLSYEQEIKTILSDISNINQRLERLYDAIETGNVDLGDIGPRIKDLRSRQEKLMGRKAEVDALMSDRKVELMSPQLLAEHVNDLHEVLNVGSLTEKKSFIKGFVEDITVTGNEALLTYTYPLLPKGETQEKIGVLSSVQYGGPGWIRTNDQSVMSRPLYH